jgi:hypothetical protein
MGPRAIRGGVMAKRKPVAGGEEGPNPPSLGQVYPAIAR